MASTLTAGTGISIENGSGSIRISADGINISFIENDNTTATPANNILYLYGSAAQGIITSGYSNTVMFYNLDWTTAQKGVGFLAQDSEAIAGTVSTKAIVPTSLKAKLGDQTAYALPVSLGSTLALSWLGPLTNGQVLIGRTGNVPRAAILTAGTGVSIDNAPGSITLGVTNTNPTMTITPVSASYTVTASDYFLSLDTTTTAITLWLPDSPSTGRVLIIKDATGNSAAKNIRITTVSGVKTIDGQTTYLIANNYESIQTTFNGASYEVF